LAVQSNASLSAATSSQAVACDPLTRAQILLEALPYIQQYQGRIMVIKYGGAAMVQQERRAEVLRDIVFLACVGIRPVLVHGGGPEINSWLQKLDIPFKFVDGLRVTDAATMEVVEMVLVGKVNKQIVQLISWLADRRWGCVAGMATSLELAPRVERKLALWGR
jgi:acetylglutamate kinase